MGGRPKGLTATTENEVLRYSNTNKKAVVTTWFGTVFMELRQQREQFKFPQMIIDRCKKMESGNNEGTIPLPPLRGLPPVGCSGKRTLLSVPA